MYVSVYVQEVTREVRKGSKAVREGRKERREMESEEKCVNYIHLEPIMNVFPPLFDGPHETVPGPPLSRGKREERNSDISVYICLTLTLSHPHSV